MNKAYREYLISQWKEAEEIANEIGAINNATVGLIFDKITQPYYYWNKNGK